MATKQEQEVARQQRDALIQLTTDVKHILIALKESKENQKEINGSMFKLHEKSDKRLDAIETKIEKAKGIAWGAALGGGTGGAGLMAFLSKFLNGGG